MKRWRVLSLVAAMLLTSGVGVGLAAWTTGGNFGASASGISVSPRPSVVGHAPKRLSAAGPDNQTVVAGTSTDIACPAETGTAGAAKTGDTARHLFTRTTSDGVTIRVYRLTAEDVAGCGPVGVDGGSSPGSSPQALQNAPTPVIICGSDQALIEMSDDSAVGQGDLGLPTEPPSVLGAVPVPSPPRQNSSPAPARAAPSEPRASSAGAFGVVEGDPVWWVGVQVSGDVAQVELTLIDGSIDQMAPVDGVAVLAHHVALPATGLNSDLYGVQGTMKLLDASGNVLSTLTIPTPSPPLPSSPTTGSPSNATESVSSSAAGSPVRVPANSPNGSNPLPSGTTSTPSDASSLPIGAAIACPGIIGPGVAENGKPPSPSVIPGSVSSLPPPLATTSR